MKRIIYHILIPHIMRVVFFRIAMLPVEVLGCVAFPASGSRSHYLYIGERERHPINKNIRWVGGRTRGLSALLITFISVLAALGAAIMAARGRMQGDGSALWWAASSKILTI